MSSIRFAPVIRLFAAALLIAGLGACATTGGSDGSGSFAELLSRAESEVAAGRIDPAIAAFDRAAMADPTRKDPWLRIAQLQFDAGNYGRAIVAAEEVLMRDPDDKVADSVLTVAGLRIASQSLQRLQGNGALASGTARTEAERLAVTMRATMGEDILASEAEAPPKRRSAPRRRAPAPTPKVEQKPAAANPFGVLGG